MPLTNISGAQYQYLSYSTEHHHEIHSNHMCYLGALPLPSKMPCLVSMTFTMTQSLQTSLTSTLEHHHDIHVCGAHQFLIILLTGVYEPNQNLHIYVICTYEPSRVYTSGWCLYPPPCCSYEMRYPMGITHPWLVLMSHLIAHKLLIGVHKH